MVHASSIERVLCGGWAPSRAVQMPSSPHLNGAWPSQFSVLKKDALQGMKKVADKPKTRLVGLRVFRCVPSLNAGHSRWVGWSNSGPLMFVLLGPAGHRDLARDGPAAAALAGPGRAATAAERPFSAGSGPGPAGAGGRGARVPVPTAVTAYAPGGNVVILLQASPSPIRRLFATHRDSEPERLDTAPIPTISRLLQRWPVPRRVRATGSW